MTVTVNTGNVERDDSGWSIDELAALIGVPSRTIREYRTIGVLAPPRRVGRVGRYDESHRRRLTLIGQMQERGYSLAAIRDLFSAREEGRSLDDVLDFGGGGFDEAPMTLTSDQLVARVPALRSPLAQQKAVDAGLLVSRGPEQWIVRSASLLALVGDITREGAPLDVVLGVVVALRAAARAQAHAVTEVFGDHVWPELAEDRAVAVARRARPLVARAAASLIVDELGTSLRARAAATADERLEHLVSELSIGTVRSAGSEARDEDS